MRAHTKTSRSLSGKDGREDPKSSVGMQAMPALPACYCSLPPLQLPASADRHVGHSLGDFDTLLSAVLPNTGLYQKIPRPSVELNGKEVNGSGRHLVRRSGFEFCPDQTVSYMTLVKPLFNFHFLISKVKSQCIQTCARTHTQSCQVKCKGQETCRMGMFCNSGQLSNNTTSFF